MNEELKVALSRISNFITDNVSEVKNKIGGVVGYELNLNQEETLVLWDLVDEASDLLHAPRKEVRLLAKKKKKGRC